MTISVIILENGGSTADGHRLGNYAFDENGRRNRLPARLRALACSCADFRIMYCWMMDDLAHYALNLNSEIADERLPRGQTPPSNPLDPY